MSQQFSITFPFSVLIPEEIANTIPDFPVDQYTPADMPINSSGSILLSNTEIETEMENEYYNNQMAFDYFEIIDQLVQTLVQEGETMVGTVTFNDGDDPTEMFKLMAKHNIIVTPITS